MSYDDRVFAAVALIKQHNEVIGDSPATYKDEDVAKAALSAGIRVHNPGAVDCDKFVANLKAFGATSEESLLDIRWESILKCLVPALYVPGPVEPEQLARAISNIFRKSEDGGQIDKPGFVGAKKVQRMTIRQLVEHFDPEEPEGEVGKRLLGIVGKNPCIVFDKPGSRVVDVEATYSLVDELKKKYPPRPVAKGEVWAICDVRGVKKPAFPLGFLPENFAEENPIYFGHPLRPDGTCTQTNRSWAGIPLEVRQLVRIHVQQRKNACSIEDAHHLMDMALLPNAFETLSGRYGDARVKFDELKSHNKLPDLQIALGQPAPQGKTPNPFDGGAQVGWAPVPQGNYYSPTPGGTTTWGHAVRARHWNG